jgi:hypothetical protein
MERLNKAMEILDERMDCGRVPEKRPDGFFPENISCSNNKCPGRCACGGKCKCP